MNKCPSCFTVWQAMRSFHLFYLKNYSFLAALSLCCYTGCPLVRKSRGSSLVAVCGLLVAAQALGCAGFRSGTLWLAGSRAQAQRGSLCWKLSFLCTRTNKHTWSRGLNLIFPLGKASTVVAHGLSCSAACGVFLDEGSKPCLLHWQADSLPLSHQGSPISYFEVPFLLGFI